MAAEVLGVDAPMHKYAIQMTVADVRDGALSGSTLKEASSWGKVDTTFEQMVYAEATLALPLWRATRCTSGRRRAEGKQWDRVLWTPDRKVSTKSFMEYIDWCLTVNFHLSA